MDGDDGGGLFISDDGGLTWARSVGQPGSLRVYNGLVVDPTKTQRLIWGATGNNGGVWISEDRGATWRRALSSMTYVFDVAVAPNGTIYAAGDMSGPTVFTSIDHGVTWRKIPSFGTKGAAEGLAIDPTNQSRIAVSAVQWSNSAPGKIFLSSDAGLTWTEITEDLPH